MHKNSYKKAEKDNLGRDKNEKNQNRYFSILVDGNYWISSSDNPFTDVPEGHWAYNSINKLVDAGIVEGYNNGHYGGDRLITRYEMAQIVAKADGKRGRCRSTGC